MPWTTLPPSARPIADAVLTKRQREILQLADAGASDRRIARALCIHRSTVREHREVGCVKLEKALRACGVLDEIIATAA
jgi:DNA-binding CsgD family transcriptional regulator